MQDSLETKVQYIKGVGPKLAAVLARMGILTVGDILYHFPLRYIDRRKITSIGDTLPGKDRTIIADIVTSGISFLGRRRTRIFEVIASDGTGAISAKWFNFHPSYMMGRFPKGARVLFAGELTEYNGIKQFVHPEVERIDNDDDTPDIGGKLLPIYPSTEGLSQRTIRKIIRAAIEKFGGDIVDPFPVDFINKHNLEDARKAVLSLHSPPNDADVDSLNSRRSNAHRTIIFSEFFLFELALALRRASTEREAGIAFEFKKDVHDKILSILPFSLTRAQEKVIGEIKRDMARPHPMNRLLQGDVGSGKTIVALAAAMQAVANGYQAAFMAPTEILAEQHYHTIVAIADKIQISVALLTANVKGEERDSIYRGVANGAIPLLIGTHAIIQSDVKFKNLGLAVIDEQHRFGVMQRQALRKKGGAPDILVMTATPIPRTLAMTLYGDLEVSVLDEMPSGRKPIITKIYHDKQREKLYNGMRVEVERGHQIYVVYPLIEESEKVDLKNATEMAEELKGIFAPKARVELLHGRMKGEEKDRIMREFKEDRVQILAATSVVEVGVDVANASVMVIEHAERFGLAQLHQLRGRVGRGTEQSFCVLVTGFPLSEEAKRRLSIMVETTDGFRIAEEDLSIRGPGEFLGTRQSGVPAFKLADLVRDVGVLQLARQAAFEIVAKDPKLELQGHHSMAEAVRRRSRLELGGVG